MLNNPIFWIPVRTIAAKKEDWWMQCTKCGNMINKYALERLRFNNIEEYQNAIKEKYQKCEKCGSKMDTALTYILGKRGIAKGDHDEPALGGIIKEIMDGEDHSFYKKYGF